MTRMDVIWKRYQEFLTQLGRAGPIGLSRRNQDRYLWAKAVADQLQDDIQNGFRKQRKGS